VLVKSVYGGGGRGIRTASNKKELQLNFASAQREAKTLFGRFVIYVEKTLVKPRHVEFQILCDEQGNRIHLAERECSIQRRFQKLVEFSPSPVVNVALRGKIGSRAVKIAELFDYQNAGTVEFLFSDGEFYFIEVNSRLQVEHPITEMLTGIDIVKEQIKVAKGDSLRINQGAVSLRGAAIECRINAEDSTNDFAPSAGKITSFQQPAGPGIRVDTALHEGYEVTFFYDSLIAKLVAWATDMREAMARMRTALSEFVIEGVKTTIPFHRILIDDPEFLRLNLSTSFIDDRSILAKINENGAWGSSENEEVAALAAVIFRNMRRDTVPMRNSSMSCSKWRNYPVTDYTETPIGRFPDVL
jgi:acetyl/propionyl-CoA carboxylase alpha subunit